MVNYKALLHLNIIDPTGVFKHITAIFSRIKIICYAAIFRTHPFFDWVLVGKSLNLALVPSFAMFPYLLLMLQSHLEHFPHHTC